MALNRNKLYFILSTACIAGYIWIYFIIKNSLTGNKTIDVCLIKRFTNIPCPSCGASRSIIAIINGNLTEALYLNPLGYIIAVIMLITPIWIITDVIKKTNTLFLFYLKAEVFIRKKQVAIPLILIIVTNWIWNITKGL